MQKKKIFLILFMIFLVCVSAFAQGKGGPIEQLDQWGERIVGLLSSTWLKAICIVALVAIAIGMIVAGRNEQGLMKKFIPWLIGTIILLSATNIVSYFFGGAEFKISLIVAVEQLFWA